MRKEKPDKVLEFALGKYIYLMDTHGYAIELRLHKDSPVSPTTELYDLKLEIHNRIWNVVLLVTDGGRVKGILVPPDDQGNPDMRALDEAIAYLTSAGGGFYHYTFVKGEQ